MLKAISPQGSRTILSRYLGPRFLQMSRSSFGRSGTFRGNIWLPLKKGGSATEERSGALKASIKMQVRANYVTISTDNPYAAAQFLGNKNLPPRRFMPMENQGKNNWRPIQSAHRQLMTEWSKALWILSGGAFPRVFSFPLARFERGNPTTPPNVVRE